jgi:hypothetical protein
MAQSMKEANVYRVCAEGPGRWHVYQDSTSQPVASFHEKAAALNYAMCLARGRVAWHLLLRQNGSAHEGAKQPRRNPHH